MIKTVRKRSGEVEDFDAQKLLHWMEWAEVIGVDWPPIMMEVYRTTGEATTSEELHQAMINAFLALQTEQGDKMAGRLYIGSCYKKCFGDIGNTPTLLEFYQEMVELGYWGDMGYSSEELVRYEKFIDHNKDLDYSYTQLQQIVEKYSAQDRTNGTKFETPQFTFMRMALGLAKVEQNPEQKEKDVLGWYKSFAIDQTINAPTPNYVNLGTHNKGYASCVLFTCDDDAASLAIGDYIANTMTCASAGIGHHSFIRCEKDPIRGGIVSHKGKINYFKSLAASVNANTQSSRGGSATTHAFCLDPDTEEMIRMRHPTTVPKKRVPELDFSMGHNREFRKRAALNQDWPQISYHGNEELYESAYRSNEEFEERLSQLENSGKKIKNINARKLMLKYLAAAQETGRKYHHNIDEINRHTPFKDPIWQSNLCQEIVQPTRPFFSVGDLDNPDSNGEISTCNLAAIVPSRLRLEMYVEGFYTPDSVERYEEACYYSLKMIDNVIEYMEYPFKSLEHTAKSRRNAGVGITGLAHHLAKMGFKYSSKEGKEYIHKLAELHSYCLHKASLRLAKERGVCGWAHKTKYPEGWTPLETYNRNVDKVVQVPLQFDWEALRKEIVKVGGLRNSVLEAFMPCESSSLASGTPNSLYPIRELKTIKTSASGKPMRFIAPDLEELKDSYEMAWDIDVRDMLEVYAIFQKFCGQAISADLWIDRSYSSGKFSGKKALDDFLYGASIGVKTCYYTNSKNGGKIDEDDGGCADGVCKM